MTRRKDQCSVYNNKGQEIFTSASMGYQNPAHTKKDRK